MLRLIRKLCNGVSCRRKLFRVLLKQWTILPLAKFLHDRIYFWGTFNATGYTNLCLPHGQYIMMCERKRHLWKRMWWLCILQLCSNFLMKPTSFMDRKIRQFKNFVVEFENFFRIIAKLQAQRTDPNFFSKSAHLQIIDALQCHMLLIHPNSSCV